MACEAKTKMLRFGFKGQKLALFFEVWMFSIVRNFNFLLSSLYFFENFNLEDLRLLLAKVKKSVILFLELL